MTTAIAERAGLPGQLLDNGYVLPPDLTFDEWQAVLSLTEHIVAASPWWLTDAIEYGRQRFGERHTQAFPTVEDDPEGASQARMKQAAWMADSSPRGTRVPGQSYSAHRAVAKLNRDDAVALLEMTDADGKRLTVRELAKRADAVEEAVQGKAVTIDGVGVQPSDDLAWTPTKADLVDECRARLEIRLSEMSASRRLSFEAGWIAAHVEANALSCFVQEDQP